MAIQSQELRILVRALTDPSVQVAAREVVVFLRQIQGDLRAVSQEARSTEGIFGHMTGGIVGFLRDVAATASGILVRDVIQGGLRLLKEGLLELGGALIEVNAKFELLTTTITIMAGSQEKAAQFMEVFRQMANETGRSMSEMVELGQPFVRFAGGSSKALQDLIKASTLLQALKPQAGPYAAMIAITEALSGQFRSLQMRFEIGKEKIQAVLDEGYKGVEALLEVLKREGSSWELVTAQANTFQGVITTLKGAVSDFFRVLGLPVFEELRDDLISVRDWVRQNEEGIMALAQVIGTELANAYQFVRNTLTKWLGLEELSLDRVVQWGMNFIASLVNGILDGVDRYLMPAIVAVASLIASFLAGASPPEQGPLADIDEGGAKMLEAYVEGILNSDAPQKVREVAEEIRRELFQDERLARLREMVAEAQRRGAVLVEAAQKRVAAAQREVEEATRRVQAAQEKLNEFARDTAEIPERFTRARKRQLEAELRAAQQEQQGKQEALKATQEIMRAAQEQSRAIVEAARQHEQTIKQQMAAEEKRLRLLKKLQEAVEESGWGAPTTTGDLDQIGTRIDQLIEKYKLMWRIAMAGPPGEEGEAGAPGRYAESKWASITGQFETLSGSVEIIARNAGKIADAFMTAAGFAQDLIDGFNKLPPWVQNILKGVGVVVALNLATGGLVTALVTALASVGIAAGPVGWTLIGGAMAIYLVIANQEELKRTINEIISIPGLLVAEAIPEEAGPLKDAAVEAGQTLAEGVEDGVSPLPGALGLIMGGIPGMIAGQWLASKLKIGAAVKEGLQDPTVSTAEETAKEVVSRSIVPDMIDDILAEYERLRYQVLPAIEKFVQDALDQFRELSDWLLEEFPLTVTQVAEYTEQMGLGFDQLTAEVNALNLALERLVELLERLPALPNLPTVGEVMTRQAAQPAMATALAGRAAGLTARAGMGETPYLHVGLIDQRGWQISADVDEITVKRWSRESALAAIRQVLREAR